MILVKKLMRRVRENPLLGKEIFYTARHSDMDREEVRQLIHNIGHIEHLTNCHDNVIYLAEKSRFLDSLDESIIKYVQRKRGLIAI